MEKIQTNIYKLVKIDFDSLINILERNGYQKQLLNNSRIENIVIFYEKFPSPKKWKNFLREIVAQDQPIINNITEQERFIILIKKDDDSIYAVTGGGGHFGIKDYIENDFGFKIASCLINKESKVIKSSKEKSVMSKILGQAKYFRTESTFLENDEFGNFYQELNILIDKQKLIDNFNFSPDEVRKNCICVAKNSFKINKSLTFREMLKIVDGLDFIIKNKEPVSFNNVEIVSDKELIENLNDELIDQLWKRCYQNNYINFDLCDNDFENYLRAERYVVRKKSKILLDTADRVDSVDIILRDNPYLSCESYLPPEEDKDEFKNFIKSLEIDTFDIDNNQLTSNDLLMHIHGDIEIDINSKKKRFFLINGVWYLIKDEFIKKLNSNCKRFVENYYDNGLDKKWDKDKLDKLVSEDDYNFSYIDEKNTLALHKIESRNIELCDILKWDDKGNVYFYHVKKSFDNSLRDLCSQIFLAASTLQNEKEFKKEIFDKLKNSDIVHHGKSLKNQLSRDFEKVIDIIEKAQKIYFVLSFVDTRKEAHRLINEDAEEINNFKSNIAKFSLYELILNMKRLDRAELKINQIVI